MKRMEKLKKRFYAFYIDLVAITLIQKIVVFTYQKSIRELFPTLSLEAQSKLFDNVWQVTLSTLTLTFFSYFIVSMHLGNGKTLGKSLLGLRVYSPENTTPSFLESVQRTLVYTGCYLMGSFLLLIPFARKDSKGIPDMISHTEVVTEEEFQAIVSKSHGSHEGTAQLELFKSAS